MSAPSDNPNIKPIYPLWDKQDLLTEIESGTPGAIEYGEEVLSYLRADVQRMQDAIAQGKRVAPARAWRDKWKKRD